MYPLNSGLKASTLAEVLVTMVLSGLLLLAAYDGLDIINNGVERYNDTDEYEQLDWLEHYEILEFRSDSVSMNGRMFIFYMDGEPCDTLMCHGF
ncbi:MAG: hypothetical protein IJ005_03590 [Bacteroidales bacterium]|nr:hypothetical protein [Bacteroidales bacterium]